MERCFIFLCQIKGLTEACDVWRPGRGAGFYIAGSLPERKILYLPSRSWLTLGQARQLGALPGQCLLWLLLCHKVASGSDLYVM